MPLMSWRVAVCMALSPALAEMRCSRPSGWIKVIAGMGGPSGWLDRDGQAFETAQRVVVAALHFSSDLDRSDLARQRRQHDFALEARDQLANAHMDAGAEADMARRAAGDVVAVRVFPAARIAVGGAEKHQDFLALADGVAAKLDLARGGAEEGLHRALEADRLLEGVARQRGIAAQPRQLVPEARQAIDRGANAVDGRIDPGRQQRAHQERRFLMGDVAGICAGMDAGTE